MKKEIKLDKLYDHAYDWIIRFGPRFLIGIAILFIGLWLIKAVLNRSHKGMQRKELDPSVKPFLLSMIGVALRILLVIGVMQIIGIEMTLFTAIVGAFGVAIGLALSGTLQNFASGILILLLKPFVVGDNIITQGLEGTVTAIEIFYTIVTAFDNRLVIVPNSKLSNEVIINVSREGSRRLDINYKFPNNVDTKAVKAVIANTLDNSQTCLKSPEKRIGVGELQPDGYVMSISVWVNAHGFNDNKLIMEPGGVMVGLFKDKGINVVELYINGIKTLLNGYKRFKAVVVEFKPDIIHSHMIHANYFAAIFKLLNYKPKLISTAHNTKEGSKLMMMGYNLTRSIPNWSTNVSKEAFDKFIHAGHFSSKHSSYIPNAIDTNLFNPINYNGSETRQQLGVRQNAYVFFSAGRLYEQKNYPMLLNAFKIVHGQLKQAVLVIAGEGPLLPALTKMCVNLGISSNTFFIGRRNDIPALMSMCDCFVLSSGFEGFGLVVGEAMAMQKPVVATNCGGVKEVMGGLGTLINVNDTAALANAMVKAGLSASNYLPISRKHIENNYSVASVINQWIQLYYSV